MLSNDGYAVFPVAKTILVHFGGLRLAHIGSGDGPSRYDFIIDPTYWLGEGDRVSDIEQLVDTRLCPLGETSGAAMLAVLDDGRVISEFEGEVHLLGNNWRVAMDHLVLGWGQYITIAVDYVRIHSEDF